MRSRANSSSMAACPSKRMLCLRSASDAAASNRRPALDVHGALTADSSERRKARRSTGVKAATGARCSRSKTVRPVDGEQDAERRAAWLADGHVPARQPERSQVGDPRGAFRRHTQELAAPDRPVGAEAGAVPRHAQHRRRAARSRPCRTARARGGAAPPRCGCARSAGVNASKGNPGGVARDAARLELVEAPKSAITRSKAAYACACLEVADVLADEHVAARSTAPRCSSSARRRPACRRPTDSIGTGSGA